MRIRQIHGLVHPLGFRGFRLLVPIKLLMDGSKDRSWLRQVNTAALLKHVMLAHSLRLSICWTRDWPSRWVSPGSLILFSGSVSLFRSLLLLVWFVLWSWAKSKNELLASSLCQCTVGKLLVLQNELHSSSFTFFSLHKLWQVSSVRSNPSSLHWLITDTRNRFSFLLLVRQLLSTLFLFFRVSLSWPSSISWLMTTFRKSSAAHVVRNAYHLWDPRASLTCPISPLSRSRAPPARRGTPSAGRGKRPSGCSWTLGIGTK